MGLDLRNFDTEIESSEITILVPTTHILIILANILNWNNLCNIVIEDLKNSTSILKWWIGRKLIIRIHLAVYILQLLLKQTDRGIEEAIKWNAVFKVFCGFTIMEKWHCPDHTKIEEFRNRLSPETQRKINNYVLEIAKQHGFANPKIMDVDSTVQEANMTYPTDATLLTKLGGMAKKISVFFKRIIPDVDIKKIKKISKEYFFMKKNVVIEKKKEVFKKLYNTVKEEVEPLINAIQSLEFGKDIPWYIKRTINQIKDHASKYLEDVEHFIKTQTIKSGKILSFHLKDVACIIKGKVGKAMEFGRVFQLGRIGGNYVIALKSETVRMEDKKSIVPMIEEHENIFGIGVLESVGADKGYYSADNVKILISRVKEVGIQTPANIKNPIISISQEVKDRRAGIEPLIGHIKRFGLGKSNAKSDESTLASGYRSILAFNLHQIMRHTSQKLKNTKISRI